MLLVIEWKVESVLISYQLGNLGQINFSDCASVSYQLNGNKKNTYHTGLL